MRLFDGGDIQAAGEGGYMEPDDEMMRQRRERMQAARVPSAVQAYEPQAFAPAQELSGGDRVANRQAPQIQSDSGMNGSDSPRPPQRAPQPTFNELQKEGKPRPAPPAPEPQQAVAMPQDSMITTRAEPGQINPWTGQMTPPAPPAPEPQQAAPAVAYDGGMITTRAEPGQINPWTGQMTPPAPTRETPVREPKKPTIEEIRQTNPELFQRMQQLKATQPNFDVGQYLQTQLQNLPARAKAPTFKSALDTSKLMGMNAAVTGMPNEAYNPGQFDSTEYMTGLREAIGTAGKDLSPAMYGAGSTSAKLPSIYGEMQRLASNPAMYGATVGDPSAALTKNVQGLYGREVGNGALPQFKEQGLTAGGLDVATELANLYRGGQLGVSDEVSKGISAAIANPSAYNSDLVKNIYGQLGQNIDDQYALEQKSLRDEMAARGLSDTSIMGGKMADLNISKRSAREGLANQLGQLAAQDYSSARDRALGMGMQRDSTNLGARTGTLNQLLGTQQAAANLGFQNLDAQLGLDAAARARQAQRFSQDAGALGMQNDMNQQAFDRARGRFSDQLAGQQFQSQLDQQLFDANRARFGDQLAGQQFQSAIDQQNFDMNRGRFQDQLANAQFQQGARQQNVQNQLALGNQGLNFFNANAALGQQNFQNQLGLAQAQDQLTGNRFNREMQGLGFLSDREQQQFQNDLASSQFDLTAGDQNYQQGLGYLDRMMGYGQQAFQNDMTQAEFNRLLQNDQDRMLMAMLGLGG